MTRPSRDLAGRVLGGRYRLVTLIGVGASAHVYLADDTSLRRRVAIKLLHEALADDAAFLSRFRAEARSVGINWLLGPVADLDLVAANPIVQTRSFGADPDQVGEQVGAWIAGAHEAGVLTIPSGNQIVRLLPALNLTRAEAAEGIALIELVVKKLA